MWSAPQLNFDCDILCPIFGTLFWVDELNEGWGRCPGKQWLPPKCELSQKWSRWMWSAQQLSFDCDIFFVSSVGASTQKVGRCPGEQWPSQKRQPNYILCDIMFNTIHNFVIVNACFYLFLLKDIGKIQAKRGNLALQYWRLIIWFEKRSNQLHFPLLLILEQK